MNTDKLFHNQDEVMENIMLFSPMPVLQAIQDSFTESVLADMHAEDAEIFAETIPVHKSGKSRKSRRAVRINQNKRHKGSDRAHGKKRMPSTKSVREADRQDVYHAHAKFVWHENHKGKQIPRTVRKHDKFRQERFVPSPDWDGTPDPLMPAERLERNQQIEQLKNQLDITDWEMRNVTDRIQWCREDIEEIEFMKSKEAEVRQSLKEWQDRLDTLAREYHDLTERILNLSV